jgi:predicted nucleic acid-binding protein
MHVYADTSVLFALCHPADPFFAVVNKRDSRHHPQLFYPPWLRFEVRHSLTVHRKSEEGEAAWRALLAAERSFVGVRENWLSVIQLAGELSAQHGRKILCGGMDVLHVASAVKLEAEEFWTCDEDQAEFARATGLKVVDFSTVV